MPELNQVLNPSINNRIAKWLEGSHHRLIKFFGVFIVLAATAAMLFSQPVLAGLPLALLALLLWAYDFRPYYYLLLLATPLSMEFAVGNSLSTDIPTEPLMLMLTLTFGLVLLLKRKSIKWKLFKHPLVIILGLQLVWYGVTLIFSVDRVISAKWIAAKIWYIAAFGGITLLVYKKPKDFRLIFWCLFLPTLFTVIYTLIRHSGYGFGFVEVNLTVEPFYRNHVNYAVYLALIYPFIWVAATWYPRYSWPRMLLQLSKIIFLFAIYFSYTRSSWISLAAGLIGYVLIRKNLLKEAAAVGILAVFLTSAWMLQNNRYLDFAPDFSKTIYHDDFADHMAATTSLEDVSSAERIYRWVAGWYMFTDKPLTGFGPGNFYPHYQNYTVSSFYTYISRNEERSTIHNYYLLSLVESGLIGSLLFWALIITAIFRAQSAYKRRTDREGRNLLIAISVSLITILVNLFFSDLVEADKIGTLFYALIALIVVSDQVKYVKS